MTVEQRPVGWEYTIVEAHGLEELRRLLNEAGRAGWEAAGVLGTPHTVLLKRPLGR